MAKIDEEMIAAYVDGELNAEQRTIVEEALAIDPELRAAINRYKALRNEIEGAFAPILSASTPSRFTEILTPSPAPRHARRQAGGWRDNRKPRSAATARVAAAMAASFLIGITISALLTGDNEYNAVKWASDMTPSEAVLSASLESAPPGVKTDTITVMSTYQNSAGRHCRTFFVGDEKRLEGLACRFGTNDWRLTALTPTPPRNVYRTAGEKASALDSILSEYRHMPADEEALLLSSEWRRPLTDVEAAD